ncbi:hypothetical protein D3C80_1521930 [compost metagenome]
MKRGTLEGVALIQMKKCAFGIANIKPGFAQRKMQHHFFIKWRRWLADQCALHHINVRVAGTIELIVTTRSDNPR